MKRLVLVTSLIAIAVGCSPRPIVPRGPTRESRYLEGFMDGYRSAHPDQPYARDVGSGPRTLKAGSSDNAYRQGWQTGYRTGREDVKQRE